MEFRIRQQPGPRNEVLSGVNRYETNTFHESTAAYYSGFTLGAYDPLIEKAVVDEARSALRGVAFTRGEVTEDERILYHNVLRAVRQVEEHPSGTGALRHAAVRLKREVGKRFAEEHVTPKVTSVEAKSIGIDGRTEGFVLYVEIGASGYVKGENDRVVHVLGEVADRLRHKYGKMPVQEPVLEQN